MDTSSELTPHGSSPNDLFNLGIAGDALALVHSCFGELPEDSLVLIGIMDGRTGGHLRVDLSGTMRAAQSRAAQYADWLAGPQAEPAPDAVMALLFCPEQPSPETENAYAELLFALATAFWEDHATVLSRVWHIGGPPGPQRRIRALGCQNLNCCPFPGMPAEEQLAAALQAHPELQRARVSAPQPRQALAEYLRPAHPPSEADRHLVQELADCSEVSLAAEPLAALWDETLRKVQQTQDVRWLHQDTEHIGALLATLRRKRGRDALIPLSALGFHPALAGMRFEDLMLGNTTIGREDFDELGDHEQLTLVSQSLPGESAPELAEQMLNDYAACWAGATDYAPNWDRIDALDRILRELLAYARGMERESALNVKAWIEWARGRGSVSAEFIQAVLTEFPDSTLAGLLARFSEAFGVCPWARVKRQSHSWRLSTS